MLISLVIPTYNEAGNIPSLVTRTTAALQKKTDSFEIIIVDDDSPDGTWKVAEELAQTNSHVRVIRRRGKRGLATAVVAGWKSARGEIVGVMDGDLQHPPETLPALLEPIITKQAEIAVASRHIKGGGISEWGLHRRFLSWAISWVVKLLLRGVVPPLRDPMSGYFLATRAVVEGAHLQPRGYKILLEALAKGAYRTVVEVPYIFSGRKQGKSKAGPKECLDSIVHFGQLRRQRDHRGARPKSLYRDLFSRRAAGSFTNEISGAANIPEKKRQESPLLKVMPFNRWDLLCLIVVGLIGIIRLPQPFSSDQAVFTIIASNVSEGAIPYRDLWDVKQPGIFYFYLAGGLLFGFHEVGIHLFELCFMLAFAAILILTLKDHFKNRAIASLIPLFTVGMYFATSGDWHQTQPESLMGVPTFLSLWFVFKSLQRGVNRNLWLFLSGFMGGMVLLFKFAFLPILLAFWLTALRDAVRLKEKPLLMTAVDIAFPVAVGLLIPVVAMLGYFAYLDVLNLALWTFFEYPVIAMREAPFEIKIHSLVDGVVWFLQNFAPLLALGAIGAFRSFRAGENYLTRNLVLWIALGVGVILLQRLSWWQYHFMLFFVPLGLLGIWGLDVLWPHLKKAGSEMNARQRQVVAAFSLILLFSPLLSNLALTSIRLARHGFVKDEDRLRYQSNVSQQYNVVAQEVAFLWEPTSLPGEIYVFGDALYYYLSGRNPAIPILARVLKPPAVWARLLKSLYAVRPPYIFISNATLEELRSHTPEAVPYMQAANHYIHQHYDVLRESDAGTWYVISNIST